ncbi:MAG: hypothetical protein CSA26_08730 [Desulfobacterales bacterium]|nr:MAG: hypothetical protein CSA26_08730 [Desulfobacterales bacterium]
MSDFSKNFSQFEVELSNLITKSNTLKSREDLKYILISLTTLQKIVCDEINLDKQKAVKQTR